MIVGQRRSFIGGLGDCTIGKAYRRRNPEAVGLCSRVSRRCEKENIDLSLNPARWQIDAFDRDQIRAIRTALNIRALVLELLQVTLQFYELLANHLEPKRRWWNTKEVLHAVGDAYWLTITYALVGPVTFLFKEKL